jgi:hypothetical protein
LDSRSKSFTSRLKLAIQAKLRSPTQRLGSRTKPRLACGSFTTSSAIPWSSASSSACSPV